MIFFFPGIYIKYERSTVCPRATLANWSKLNCKFFEVLVGFETGLSQSRTAELYTLNSSKHSATIYYVDSITNPIFKIGHTIKIND